ncbi:MAG: HAD family hydrolase [Verrucomicrobiales bacterium]
MAREVSSILCFDLDGTLVDPEGRFPFDEKLSDYLTELRSQGAVLVVNTGRTLFQALEGFNQHHLRLLPDYLIAQESELYRPGGYSRWLPFGDWNTQCASDHRKLFKTSARFFKKIRNFIETSTGASYFPAEEGPSGVVARNDEEMDMICDYIERERRNIPQLGYQRNSVYLRFSHIKYNKGSTLGELARLLDLPAEYIFAAGDNHNDVSMLDGTYAHAMACPGNALDVVKELVAEKGGYVAKAPYSKGLVEAVFHYYFAE